MTDGNQNGDEEYHLKVRNGDVAESVLLPGDPDRVPKITDFWEVADEIARNREYNTVTGSYKGSPISVTSTGIGSPGAAIAIEELARVGARTFIRVGSCGAIEPNISIGDLVITTGAVRLESTSDDYVPDGYPAVADYEVVAALIAAAEKLDYPYHVGLTASTHTFHVGQGRPGFGGFQPPDSEEFIDRLRKVNVRNIEMEASAILTLANIYGLRAGAICSVYANRITDEFRSEGELRAGETASLAVKILLKMDEIKSEAGTEYWHAGLGVDLE